MTPALPSVSLLQHGGDAEPHATMLALVDYLLEPNRAHDAGSR
eukprot:CAMPEP_0115885012 /NCGR_PEP_ID=MMETSP0287-20121206/30433_1 /TAXON_ID=412157 /ORGANISM="Chrysochromulina rotalis, Strain UIO044" /LENGTH=42 /DNA_ID= /DNA_START= /DNA_END= /DNA_ORIENTATION=